MAVPELVFLKNRNRKLKAERATIMRIYCDRSLQYTVLLDNYTHNTGCYKNAVLYCVRTIDDHSRYCAAPYYSSSTPIIIIILACNHWGSERRASDDEAGAMSAYSRFALVGCGSTMPPPRPPVRTIILLRLNKQ